MSRAADPSPGSRAALGERLRWLADVLWPADDGAVVSVGRSPGDRGGSEAYLVVPDRRRARFLIPDGRRAAAARSVRAYNRLRSPRTRAARASLALALDTGLAPTILRDHLVIADESGSGLLDHLRRTVFGGRPIVAAIGIGSPGPFRKPVLQLFTPGGDALGFVKVGWNEISREMVGTEGAFLARCHERSPATFHTPRPLYRGTWRERTLSVAAPLPDGIRRWRPWREPPPVEATAELAALADDGVANAPLKSSPYWRSVRERLAVPSSAGPSGASVWAEEAARLADDLERADGDTHLRFGAWHGDWSPWNFARLGRRLIVWDWEHAAPAAPLGFDVMHFHFQLAFIADRRGLTESFEHARAASRGSLGALGVKHPDLVGRLHALEVAARYERAFGTGAGTNPRFEREATASLQAVPRVRK